MSKEIIEVKKVCQFLSKILANWQNDINFGLIKNLLLQLLNGSIDLYRFVEIFPHKLPDQCLKLIEIHLNLLREQFVLGLVEIQFIKNIDKSLQINSSNPSQLQSNPVIDASQRKILLNQNQIPIISLVNRNDNLKDTQTITPSNTKIRSVSFLSNNNDKTKIMNVSRQISFRGSNSFSIKSVPAAISMSNKKPIINIGLSNQDDDTTQSKQVNITSETTKPVVPSKKKKIDISNQCDTHNELKVLPSIQAFHITNNPAPKPANLDRNSCSTKSGAVTDSISHEEPIKFVVDETIEKIVKSAGLKSIDYEHVIPYVQDILENFSKDLLKRAAFYTAHRDNCKETFKLDSLLYKQIDDYRSFYKSLKNKEQLLISNQEREEKEKIYLEKVLY